jgi:hypothetical protein
LKKDKQTLTVIPIGTYDPVGERQKEGFYQQPNTLKHRQSHKDDDDYELKVLSGEQPVSLVEIEKVVVH